MNATTTATAVFIDSSAVASAHLLFERDEYERDALTNSPEWTRYAGAITRAYISLWESDYGRVFDVPEHAQSSYIAANPWLRDYSFAEPTDGEWAYAFESAWDAADLTGYAEWDARCCAEAATARAASLSE